MTFLPTCHPDNRPATYVPGTGYVCDPNAVTGWAPVPMVGNVPWFELVDREWLMKQRGGMGPPITKVPASAMNEFAKLGWCRGAGAYARCPWFAQEPLGAITLDDVAAGVRAAEKQWLVIGIGGGIALAAVYLWSRL